MSKISIKGFFILLVIIATCCALCSCNAVENDAPSTIEQHTISVENSNQCDYYSLALQYARENNFNEAIKYYQLAIENSPRHEEAYLQLADIYMQAEQKENALMVLKKAVSQFGGSKTLESKRLLDTWWNTLVHWDGEKQNLNNDEIANLSEIAFMLSYSECFLFAEELDKEDLLSPMGVYYNNSPKYVERTGEYTVNQNMLYPPDSVENGEYSVYSVLSASNAEGFIEHILGTRIPELHSAYDRGEYVSCRNGMYYCEMGDYAALTYSVSAYEFLGDNIFYILFDGDDSELPGNDNEKRGEIPNSMAVIAKRTGSAWGFTVLAKLIDAEDSSMRDGWLLPGN
ncbi:MAG: tetratricopeptide repeat protein [Prevotella sp.]|jgi:tetratricopeptide (TPR) repeat protein|nr:tetratricopeptide repeat protein [Prevotella sp.]